MKYLFQTALFINGQEVGYKVYLHTNGSYYAESMNPDYDNFSIKKNHSNWLTSLARNMEAAGQIGAVIEVKNLV